MWDFNCLAVLTWAALCMRFCGAESPPIVEYEQGAVQGIKSTSLNGNEFYSFMSIPYAKPPVGDLRFKDPVPSESWNGTIDGSKMPQSCLQYSVFEHFFKEDKSNISIIGSEDCLYLNVYTPKPNNETANLPVMVYIHGGAFVFGGAIDAPPNALLDKDIVLVVLQYRLGVLGFLSTEVEEFSGNMGLKDQQLALKWVKQNIAHFGGDIYKITLFGESAGSVSTFMHILSPGSKYLFHRIIAQSGSPLCPFASSDNHRDFAQQIGETFNCPLEDKSEEFADTCSAEERTEAYVECMQKIDAEQLITQFMLKEVDWGFAPRHTLPRVDGSFFPKDFETLFMKKKYKKVDVMTGITKDEGLLFYIMMLKNPTMLENLNNNFDVYGPLSLRMFEENAVELATKVYQHYLGRKTINDIDLEKDKEQLIRLYGDRFFGVCHDATSFYLAHNKKNSLYRYQLDYKSEQKSFSKMFNITDDNDWVGHGDDLFHIFSGPPLFTEPEVPEPNDVRMRDIIISAWTNFAKTGNPVSPTSDFVWEKTTLQDFTHLSLGLGLRPDPKMEKLKNSENRNYWFNLNSEENTQDSKSPSNEELQEKVLKIPF